MHDTMASGTPFRVMTLLDIFSREGLAVVARLAFTGACVASVLAEVGRRRRTLPQKIRVDNGTEFTSKALDHWAYWTASNLTSAGPAIPRPTPPSRPSTGR